MLRQFLILAAITLALIAAAAYYFYRSHQEQQTLLPARPAYGVTMLIELEAGDAPIKPEVGASMQEAIRKRFLAKGYRIHIEQVSETQLRIASPIQIPEDVEYARKLLTRQGRLQFRLVHDDNERLIRDGVVPAGYEEIRSTTNSPVGRRISERLIVNRHAESGLAGGFIKRARVTRSPAGQAEITFEMNSESAAAFADVTRRSVGRRLAIMLDGKLYSAPVIRSPIETGRGQITGQFDAMEALELASVLESSFPVPVKVLEFKSY